jgi:hypothetical protein
MFLTFNEGHPNDHQDVTNYDTSVMEKFFKKMNWDANPAVETLEISMKGSGMSTSWHETEIMREMNQMEKFGMQLHDHDLYRIKNKNRIDAKMERLLIGAKRSGANTRMHT